MATWCVLTRSRAREPSSQQYPIDTQDTPEPSSPELLATGWGRPDLIGPMAPLEPQFPCISGLLTMTFAALRVWC